MLPLNNSLPPNNNLSVNPAIQAHNKDELNKKLIEEINRGSFNNAIELVKQGADINTTNGNGATLLHFVCRFGTLKAVKLLVEMGADIHLEDERGTTALDVCLLSFGRVIPITARDSEAQIHAPFSTIYLSKNLKFKRNGFVVDLSPDSCLIVPSKEQNLNLIEIAEFLIEKQVKCNVSIKAELFTSIPSYIALLSGLIRQNYNVMVDFNRTEIPQKDVIVLITENYSIHCRLLKKLFEYDIYSDIFLKNKNAENIVDHPLGLLFLHVRYLADNPLIESYFDMLKHILIQMTPIDKWEIDGLNLLSITCKVAKELVPEGEFYVKKESEKDLDLYIRLIKLLLTYGADPKHKTSTGLVPLHLFKKNHPIYKIFEEDFEEKKRLKDSSKAIEERKKHIKEFTRSVNDLERGFANVPPSNLNINPLLTTLEQGLEALTKTALQQKFPNQDKKVQTLLKDFKSILNNPAAEQATEATQAQEMTPEECAEENFGHLQSIFEALAKYQKFSVIRKGDSCHITCDSIDAIKILSEVLSQKRWIVSFNCTAEHEIIIKLTDDLDIPKVFFLQAFRKKFERKPAKEVENNNLSKEKNTKEKVTPLRPPGAVSETSKSQESLSDFEKFEKERLAYEKRAHRREEEIWNAANRGLNADKESIVEAFDWIKHCQNLIQTDPERNTTAQVPKIVKKPQPKAPSSPKPTVQTHQTHYASTANHLPRAEFSTFTPKNAPAPMSFNLGQVLNKSSQQQFRRDRLHTAHNSLISIGDIYKRAFGEKVVYSVNDFDWARLVVRYSTMYNMLRLFESLNSTSTKQGREDLEFKLDVNRFLVNSEKAHQTRNDVRNNFEGISDKKLFEFAKILETSELRDKIANLLKSKELPDQLPEILDFSLFENDSQTGNLRTKSLSDVMSIMHREVGNLDIFAKPYKDQLFKLFTEDNDRLAAVKMSIVILSKCFEVLPEEIKNELPKEDKVSSILKRLGNAISHVIGRDLQYYHYEEVNSSDVTYLIHNIPGFIQELDSLCRRHSNPNPNSFNLTPPLTPPSSQIPTSTPSIPESKILKPDPKVMEHFFVNLIKNDLKAVTKKMEDIASFEEFSKDTNVAETIKILNLIFKFIGKLNLSYFMEGALFSDPFFKKWKGLDCKSCTQVELYEMAQYMKLLFPKLLPEFDKILNVKN